MRKIINRLLIFFVGGPFVLGSIFLFPQHNFLLLHIELSFLAIIAILEMRNILSKKMEVYPASLSIFLGLCIPVTSYLHILRILPFETITFSIGIAILIIFFTELVYSFSSNFDPVITRMASGFFLVLYPGYFVIFITLMTKWDNAQILLTSFLFIIFICDSLAWLFGILFGKNNRGYIPASPKKSLAGFIAGLLSSVIVGIILYYIFPNQFGLSLLRTLLVTFLTCLVGICGDLIESIIKRSAQIKDSGSVILGRGGVLDSIDSIIIGAPVFYLSCRYFIGI